MPEPMRVYFSYDREGDAARARTVHAAWYGPERDAAGLFTDEQWQAAVAGGSRELEHLIDDALEETAVTIVLLGTDTASRAYVAYEVAQTVDHGHPVFGIRIDQIEDPAGTTEEPGLNPLPIGSTIHLWNRDEGETNLVSWVVAAIEAAR